MAQLRGTSIYTQVRNKNAVFTCCTEYRASLLLIGLVIDHKQALAWPWQLLFLHLGHLPIGDASHSRKSLTCWLDRLFPTSPCHTKLVTIHHHIQRRGDVWMRPTFRLEIHWMDINRFISHSSIRSACHVILLLLHTCKSAAAYMCITDISSCLTFVSVDHPAANVLSSDAPVANQQQTGWHRLTSTIGFDSRSPYACHGLAEGVSSDRLLYSSHPVSSPPRT